MPVINGDDNPNILNDTPEDDTINGFGGGDTITVTAGHDTVDGGLGDDKLIVDYRNSILAITTIPIPPTKSGSSYTGTFREEGGSASVDFTGIERFEIFTGSGNDHIVTGNNDDHIVTGAGNDFLDGNQGNDVLEGGTGNDTYVAHNGSLTQIIEAIGAGHDELYAQDDNFVLTAGAEIEVIYAQYHFLQTGMSLTGNEFAQAIYGGTGADTLRGGGGADLLSGGEGSDTYYYTGTETIVDTSALTSKVIALADFVAPIALNVRVIEAGDQLHPYVLFGNSFTQTITGNSMNNMLGAGPGAVDMSGFAGNDSYFVNNANDRVFESGGQGYDVVYASLTYLLPSNQEIEVLSAASLIGTSAINLEGNQLNQLIYGNNGANNLNGGLGADTLIGLGGDDTYRVVDGRERILEDAGQGRDVVYTSVSYVLSSGASIEVLSTASLAGTTAINLTGNELAQEIYGNAGANSLRGGGGADLLLGLGGDDAYYIDGGIERVIENGGEGRDVVYASVSFTLEAGSHVEVLSTASLAGSDAIHLTGNALAQELYGNAGGNILNGGGGADLLIGGGGADFFDFTTALGGGNVDTIVDMAAGSDKIRLDDAVFAGLAPGALPASAFVIGSQAADADDRIVYNNSHRPALLRRRRQRRRRRHPLRHAERQSRHHRIGLHRDLKLRASRTGRTVESRQQSRRARWREPRRARS